MNSRSQSVLAATALALLIGTPGWAHADWPGPRSATVRYSDLNLNSREGVDALRRRIEAAARALCGPSERTGTRLGSDAVRQCVAHAVEQAVAAVDRPQLTAYYHAHQAEERGRAVAGYR